MKHFLSQVFSWRGLKVELSFVMFCGCFYSLVVVMLHMEETTGWLRVRMVVAMLLLLVATILSLRIFADDYNKATDEL